VLGEFAAHAPWLSMASEDELESSFTRAVDLHPSFSPYYIHLIGLMMAGRREAEFQEYVRRAGSMNPEDAFLVAWHISSAVSGAAGIGPDRWEVRQAPGLVRWALLVGSAEPTVSELSAAVARGPTIAEAVSAAVLAAYAGKDALRDAALEALPDTAWSGPYGRFGGAADAAEARRTATAMSHLRNGEPQAAVALLGEMLRQTSYDALAVYLMGQAQAALGAWDEALRYWDVLLRSDFRPHVRLAMGRAYEATGDTAAALESYRGFLSMWAEADQTLPPKVEAAEAVGRLGG